MAASMVPRKARRRAVRQPLTPVAATEAVTCSWATMYMMMPGKTTSVSAANMRV